MYPINIKAQGLPCLVIGGGHVALRKIKKLISEGADVTVIAPEVIEAIALLAEEGKVRWKRSYFQEGDCEGYQLVITAAGAKEVAKKVQKAALEDHFLYNAADFPPLGNCSLPAAFSAGGIEIAVSTNGRSPAMARYVKGWVARQIPDAFGLWLDRVSEIREELKKEIGDSDRREAFWRAAFAPDIMGLVIEGKVDEAEECVRHAIGSIRAES